MDNDTDEVEIVEHDMSEGEVPKDAQGVSIDRQVSDKTGQELWEERRVNNE